MKKLTKKEQVETIKRIMIIRNIPNMTYCDNCNKHYLAMNSEAEIICPMCGNELYEDVFDYEDDMTKDLNFDFQLDDNWEE